MDIKNALHEGLQLQLRVLRIDAERRRLGLSLRQVEEPDKEPTAEAAQAEPTAEGTTPEEAGAHTETAPSLDSVAPTRPRESRPERRDRGERNAENPILNNLPEGSETTAMAEAFRAAARQLSKDEESTGK
jgi:small subunit ribosomal protein S1